MNQDLYNELINFTAFIINGLIISSIFDIFKVLRKTYKTNDVITYIEDIIFWLITISILIYTIFKYSNGQIRMYIFLGILLGITLYIKYLNKYVVKLFCNIFSKINSFNNIIIKILKKILKIILLIFKPFIFSSKKLISLFDKLFMKNIKKANKACMMKIKAILSNKLLNILKKLKSKRKLKIKD